MSKQLRIAFTAANKFFARNLATATMGVFFYGLVASVVGQLALTIISAIWVHVAILVGLCAAAFGLYHLSKWLFKGVPEWALRLAFAYIVLQSLVLVCH